MEWMIWCWYGLVRNGVMWYGMECMVCEVRNGIKNM